jgi:glucose-1-phosphatase
MPSISTVIAQPLLKVMLNELRLDGRKFTFLCGHDTNLCSILSSLRVEDYSLPNTIEPDTPIGAKLVIEKRRGTDGQAYASLSLVYQSTAQIRNREMLSLEHPPMIVPLRLKGLYANEDGLYLFSDLEKRFSDAVK